MKTLRAPDFSSISVYFSFSLLIKKISVFVLINQLSQEMEIYKASVAVRFAVDRRDSKAVHEALKGKPEESHG